MLNFTVASFGTQGTSPGIETAFATLLLLMLSWLTVRGMLMPRIGDKAAEVAKHVVAGMCCVVLTVHGGYLWFNPPPGMQDNYQSRLYMYSSDFTQGMIWFMMGYQIWDLLVCLAVPALQNPISYTHHSITAFLAWLCTYPYVHYYSLFFIGFGEISTIPLACMDIFKALPQLQKSFPTANLAVSVAFALSFLSVRTFYWPTVCWSFWKDNLELLATGEQHSTIACLVFFVANIILTLMQFYWGYLVAKRLVKVVTGKDSKPKSNKGKDQ